jgi:hypothetical protein
MPAPQRQRLGCGGCMDGRAEQGSSQAAEKRQHGLYRYPSTRIQISGPNPASPLACFLSLLACCSCTYSCTPTLAPHSCIDAPTNVPAELHVRLHNAPTNAPTLAPHSRTYSCTDAPTNVTAELFLGS